MEERATAGLPAAQPPGQGADRQGLSRRHEDPPRASGAGGAVRRPHRKDDVGRPGRRPRGLAGLAGADLAGDDMVRLIDDTVVKVHLDRRATAISLLIALGIRRDGQKVVLAIRNMWGESEAAWRPCSTT